MKRLFVIPVLFLLPAAASAQVTTTNPLDELKARVASLLDEAGLPFSERQHRELALVMEEQRQASERLFGDVMDFSGGPVRGADRDRALAGIQWMSEAFEGTLEDILTPEQSRVWSEYQAAQIRADGGLPALRLVLGEAAVPLDATQEARFAEIYQQAAERLRESENGSSAGDAPANIEDQTLSQVADLLTDQQAGALLVPAPKNSAVGRGPFAPEVQSGEAAASGEALITALRMVAAPTTAFIGPTTAGATGSSSDQIAQIRINNNAFTTENFGGRGAPGFSGGGGGFRGGGGGRGSGRRGGGGGSIEVIERGGVGDYHGSVSFDFRDEALTALNEFADNKPEFQQRNINANISGPFIRDLLTASFTFNQNEQENASTVVAETPTGGLSLGVVSPSVSRQYSSNGQMQLNDRHALHFTGRYGNRDSENNGVGRFALPERAWASTNSNVGFGLREIWAVSPSTIHEAVFNYSGFDNETTSVTDGVTIDVLDAFEGGGAGRNSADMNRNYSFSNLFWYEGERLTFKTGTEVSHRRSSSLSESGFNGEFTFSSLEDYNAGRPLQYSITRGEPYLAVDQTELGAFVQTDWRLSRQFTFFAGLRYERQTTVDDGGNFDPRFGFAYSPGGSTIIRGGAGLFHQTVNLGLIENTVRLDGTRQYEILVSNPSYPDPFLGGTAEVIPPSSRRVFAPDLTMPYERRASLSVERTLPWNISVDVAYEYERGVNQLRTRDINAPFPGETERPNPDEGAILQLESTARSRMHSLQFGFRQRLSFLTYNANYTLSSAYDDGSGFNSRPMDNYNPGRDWGRSGFNEKHRYNFSVNWQAPFGTLLTVRANGNSGSPYTITTGKDDNNDQNTNDRPPGVPRNSEDGPRYFNIDMTLSKTYRLQGSSQMSVYANMQNAFDMVNLRNPSGVLTSSRFGIPTSASSARDVEIGVRYQF